MDAQPHRRGKHRRGIFAGTKTPSARRRTVFTGIAAAVGLMVAIAGVGFGVVAPTEAAVVSCDGSSTQNNLTVTAKHGPVFYIDSGQAQNVDAAYASYTISNTSSSSAQVGLWARVDSFTGSSVNLANPQDASQGLATVASSSSQSAFFLLRAKGSSASAQTHQVHVFSGKPGAAGSTQLYTCAFSFAKVAETIKAQANKVTSIVNTTVTSLGSTFTMTVRGGTGTVGSGSAIDPGIMWFSPVARSNWPTSAFRLESTSISLYKDSSYNSAKLIGTYQNTLALRWPSLAITDKALYYNAVYTFRIIGPTSSTAVVAPIAQIASGIQTKHTDVNPATGTASSITAVSPTTSLAVTKSVSATAANSAGKTTFSYTVSIANTGSSAARVDQVVDTPDPALTYVAGSAQFGGAAVSNPSVSPTDPTKLIFAEPYSITNGATGLLTYRMTADTCSSGTYSYRNSAVATVGSLVIGSSSTSSSVVTATGTCNTTPVASSSSTQALPVQVVTGSVDAIANTSAAVYGNVYPSGDTGTAITFDYGTSPTLATSSSATASPSTTAGGTISVAVSANLSGLAAGTIYYYRVRVGSVTGSILSFGTSQPQAAPTALSTTATNVTDNSTAGMSAVLNGNISPNQTPTQYKFFYGLDSSNGSCTGFTTTHSSYSTTGFIQDDGASPVVNVVLQSTYPVSVDTVSESTGLSIVTGLTKAAYYCFDLVGYYGSTFATAVDGTWVSFKASVQTAQTITFPTPADLQTGSTDSGRATASSTIPVTYTSNTPEICSVTSSGLITGIAQGTCILTANQVGNTTYSAALPVSASFLVVPPPVITNTSLGDGPPGVAYSQQLTASGGDGDEIYSSWSVVAGSLPPGLSLNSATGAITGTPTTIGTYSITFTVVSHGFTSVQKVLSITIGNTVTFDANGGTGSLASQAGSVAGALTSNAGSISRPGYTFTGWNTAVNGSGTSYADGASYPFTSSETLYAKWSADSNTVTFNANDGTRSPATVTQSITTGVSTALRANTFTRAGYTFGGWSAVSDGSGTSYTNSQVVTINGPMTVYAKWSAGLNTVTFDANGGTGSLASQAGSVAGALTSNAGSISRPGYTFTGWNTAVNGSGTSYADGASYPFTSSETLYAKWSADSNTVTFNANDGTRSPATVTQSITTGVSTALRANTFTRAGYTFGGWSAVSDGSGTSYTNSQVVTITASLTVYAKWSQSYVVIYNGNGATSGSAPSHEAGRGSFRASNNTGSLVLPGYIFAGWNTESDGTGTSYAVGARIPGGANIVLYAQWARSASLQSPAVVSTSTPPSGSPLPTATPTVGPIAPPTAQSRASSLTQIAGEEISGFAASSGIIVHVTGARTVGQFVLSSTDATAWAGVAAALDESSRRNGTSFARIPTVSTSTTAPASNAYFNGRISTAVEDVYAQSGLPKPRSVRDLPTSSTTWLRVVGNVSGYIAGSTVYIHVESQPTIFQSAIVNNRGEAVLDGYLPLRGLEAGPHTLRVVGTRQIEGVFADANGQLQLSTNAVSAIQQFDQGTTATVVLSGEGTSGANLSVSRVVYLDKDIAWWTLYLAAITALLGLIVVLVRRRAKPLVAIVTATIVTLSAVPATIIGWTTASYELWWAIPIGLGVSFVCLFLSGMLRRPRSSRFASGNS